MTRTSFRDEVRIEDVLAGAAAGVLGGLIGGYVMNQAHRLFDAGQGLLEEQFGSEPTLWDSAGPRAEAEQDEPATAKAADAVAQAVIDRPLREPEKKAGGIAMHYAFAMGMGGLYGGVAAAAPAITVGQGMPAGALLWLVADEIAVPSLGLAKPPQKYPASKHLQALINHLVFGLVVETVRRALLRAAGRRA